MTPEPPAPASDVAVRETGAGAFQVEIQAGGQRLFADEPTEVGGLGSGPNPYELLCAALGACTVMTIRLYARRKGWPLQEARAWVVHGRDGLNGTDRFAREIVLTGPLDEAQRRRLLEIAERCPVHLTLTRGSRVITTLASPHAAGEGDPGLDLPPDRHKADMDEACRD